MALVVEKQRAAEAALRRRRRWRVLVVQPIRAAEVEAPVQRPHPHRHYYEAARPDGTHAMLERRVVDLNDPQALCGELTAEERERLLEAEADAAAAAGGPAALLGDATALAPPPSAPKDERELFFYQTRYRRQLRTNGDTVQLHGRTTRREAVLLPAGAAAQQPFEMELEYHMALCVDPFVDCARFRREEAQVELISAYRNILYEAAELRGGPASAPARHLAPHTTAADVLRIPALSLYSSGARFERDLGKLNQQALIKGFHRVGNEAKERLIMNRAFSVELYVPLPFFPLFEKAFLEEAWETPSSVLSPGRVELYPGLAPPAGLLDYEGWVGKRPELVAAVQTRGRSLTAGEAPRALDGTPIAQQDVFAHVRLFGAEEELQQRLAGERASAGGAAAPAYTPLRAGLQGAEESRPADAEEPGAPLPSAGSDTAAAK
ncbi:hypothetical protein STCU_10709 [Strigomonas culicis]|uniref:Uncharacterized protein n=1 Tax=Strigomonas culicis TaxID=28005 RepID=S9TGT9_9TRYP|nr:hypothetical protein STCU_10709 [Strigomonas culicis]|eukprot:EPY17277.1 hypothetical protein STCU_10709 [Strigomonas culicis]